MTSRPPFLIGIRSSTASWTTLERSEVRRSGAYVFSDLLSGACAAIVFAGCAAEPRIVSERSLLTGVPGAVNGGDAAATSAPNTSGSSAYSDDWERTLRAFQTPDLSPAGRMPVSSDAAAGARLRTELPGGRVVLTSRSPADLMFHLMTTLRNKEHDLLLDQVISERTKQEYRRRGRDEREAVEFLAANEKDVAALLWAFPMGERTPGVIMENVGRNAFRLRAPVVMRGELRFTTLDVVIEHGQFRLLMIR